MHLASKMRSLLSISSHHHLPFPSSLPRPSPRHSPLPFPQLQPARSPPSTPAPLRAGPSGVGSSRSAATYSADSRVPGVMDARGGEIHVIVGPMFAGKTTALLRRMRAESGNGRRIAIIKSEKDDRYAVDAVVTHDGVKMPCWALSELSTFRAVIGSEAYEKLDVIGIDEAQFFGDLYDFCRNAADHDGKAVIVAGLDGDYLRRSFGSVIDLIPLADSVTKLTARCEVCGNRAFFTLRKTDETQTEVIGGAAIYMPVCRQHYVSGQVVIEAARQVLEARKAHCDSHIEVAASSHK